MATIIRRWYVYNGASGGQLDHSNYYFISSFPNYCRPTAPNICAVLGVYEIIDPYDPSNNIFFGTNPQTFAQDTALYNYILAAAGVTNYVPDGTGQKPYVYKRYF